MFRSTFLKTLQHYTGDAALQAALWDDIQNRYAEPHRHYHTLRHLEALLADLENVQSRIQDWDLIVLAAAYHDIIYDVHQNNNEEQSAAHAAKQLQGLVPEKKLELVRELIRATESHACSEKSDCNYFTDADLSILGAPPEAYLEYSAAIRAEFGIYPDASYAAGRRKVLENLLAQQHIYKTEAFRKQREESARSNLENELKNLRN